MSRCRNETNIAYWSLMVQCTKLKTTCIGEFFPPSTSSHSIYYSLVCECATRCPQSAVILHAHYKCLCTEVFVRIVLMESLYRVSGNLISSLCVCLDQTSMQYWNLNISAEKLIYQYYWIFTEVLPLDHWVLSLQAAAEQFLRKNCC